MDGFRVPENGGLCIHLLRVIRIVEVWTTLHTCQQAVEGAPDAAHALCGNLAGWRDQAPATSHCVH